MNGISDFVYSIGDWFGDAYDSVSKGVVDAVDLAGSSIAGLWSTDDKGKGPLTDRLVRGGSVDRPAGGLDVLPGAQILDAAAPLGSVGQTRLGVQFATGALNPEAYGNSFDVAKDAGPRPGLDFSLEPNGIKTSSGAVFTPRVGLWSPSNGSAFGVVGARVETASADGKDKFSLSSDLNLPFAADAKGVMPDGYLHSSAAWTHAFDKGLSMTFEGNDRHFDSGRDWLRVGTTIKATVGDDSTAQLGFDVVGSNVGSADASWRWGPRVEGSVTDPTLLGSKAWSGFLGAGFGSSPSPDAKPGVDHLYGRFGLELDTPSTESYLQVHGAAALRGGGQANGLVHGQFGSGVVLTHQPTEVTLGGFVDTQTALATGHTKVGAGPALNFNWSPSSEVNLGYDVVNDALRIGVRTDF